MPRPYRRGSHHFISVLKIPLIPLFILLYHSNVSGQVFDRTTEEYLSWIVTGKGEKPTIMPYSFQATDSTGHSPEKAGDLMTEVEHNKRFYEQESSWSGRDRIEAVRKARSTAERTDVKQEGYSLSTPPSRWTLRGPSGMEFTCAPEGSRYFSGRVSAIDYNVEKGIFIGAAKGGLWAPWFIVMRPLTERLPTQASGAVAVHPTRPDTIYFGTGDYGTQLGGGGTGVYRTTDAGMTWSVMSGITRTPSAVSRIIIAPWNNNIVFVSGRTGIWKSTDNGDSWANLLSGDISDIQTTETGSVMLAAVPGRGVVRSTNQGVSWEPTTTGLPTDYLGYMTLAISRSNPYRAFVQIARPRADTDTNRTGHVRGIYRCENIFSLAPVWTDVTPTGFFPAPYDDVPLWRYMYRQGWYHNAIAVHPADQDLVFAAGGALLKSTNGGGTWAQVPLPHDDVKVIYFRPGDNLMYVGGDGGVFTSDDEGATWSMILNQILPTTMFYNIDVSSSDDNVVFGASQDNGTEGTRPSDRSKWLMTRGNDGIDVKIDWSDPSTIYTTNDLGSVLRSTNGGECGWTAVDTGRGAGFQNYLAHDPVKASWIYFNAGDSILYSTNQGGTWGVVNPVPLINTLIHFDVSADGNYIYGVAGSSAERIVRYQWNGSLGTPIWFFKDISSGTPNGRFPVRVVASMTAPERAYVLFNTTASGISRGQRIFQTTDTGATWRNLTGDFTSGIPLHDILENPNDSLDLWIGTDVGVYRSTNGGENWWWWNLGMPDGVIVKDLEYAFSTGGDYLVAGTFGRSTFERDIDVPVGYLTGLPGLRVRDFGRFGNTIIAAGDSGGIGISPDLGVSWNSPNPPTSMHLYSAAIFDTLSFLFMGEAGTMVKTTDGGLNWTTPQSPQQFDILGVDFVDGLTGCAVGAGGRVIRSSDGGDSWSLVGNGFGGILHDVAFTDSDHGFAVGADSSNLTAMETPLAATRILLNTTDGGLTWAPDPNIPTDTGSFLSICFLNKNIGFITTSGGSVLITSDGGSNWFEKPSGYQKALYSCEFIDPGNGWACGADGTIIHTTDGGSTWMPEESGVQDDLFALMYADGMLFTGDGSGIISREVQRPLTLSYGFANRWNIISLPLQPLDSATTDIFPTAVSDAFGYLGKYVPEPAPKAGLGYWLKFAGDETLEISGYPLTRAVIDVDQGWNMVGALSSDVAVADIKSDPPGIIGSAFYGYSAGYTPAATLRPSRGYWVKVTEPGQLIIDAGARRLVDSTGVDTSGVILPTDVSLLGGLNELEISDARDNKQKLYFSMAVENKRIFDKYDMPPPPPSEMFDVRFATNKLAEYPGSEPVSSIPLRISGAAYPLSVSWTLRQRGPHPLLRLGSEDVLLSGGTGSVTVAENRMITLVLFSTGPADIPLSYTLEKNYPNPFNPVTRITYALASTEYVTLSVFNILGQKVCDVVSEVQDAGYKTVSFDAGNLPSGVYTYRITAGKFTAAKKMLLLK